MAKPAKRKSSLEQALKRHRQQRQQPRGGMQQADRHKQVVREAEELIDNGEWTLAQSLLEEYDRAAPDRTEVLRLLADVYHEQKDCPLYCRTCQRLVKLHPNNPHYLVMLGAGYMEDMRPLSACRTFREVTSRWPHDPLTVGVRETLARLEPVATEMLRGLPFPEDQRLELAALHEESLGALHTGEFARAARLCEELIRRCPAFIPALNNLSQCCFQLGEGERGLAATEQALASQPDNFHALANQCRLLLLLGHPDQTQAVADRLARIQSGPHELWCKQAETFSYLGDDRAVLAALEQAVKAGDTRLPSPETALLYHLAGVAEARLGNDGQARKHWREALRIHPGLDVAEENLADAGKPIGERHGPWPFGMNHWISRATIEQLVASVQRAGRGDNSGAEATRQFVADHPEIPRLVPALLDRGDEAGRDFAVMLAKLLATPEMHEALRVFCLSARGPDGLRMEVANHLYQQGVLQSPRVLLSIGGAQTELELMSFEIVSEPTGRQYAPQVMRTYGQALDALRAGDGAVAERLLRECLAAAGEQPDLLNNLGTALEMQGRRDAALQLIRDVHARWPDYFFGQLAMAQIAIDEKDYDRAESLLAPLRMKKRLHTTEFDALALCYVRLLMLQEKFDGARSWLNMVKQIDPDHPQLPKMERLVKAGELLDVFRWRGK